MRKQLPKHEADLTDVDIEDVRNQLDECQQNSHSEFRGTAKSIKTKVFQNSLSKQFPSPLTCKPFVNIGQDQTIGSKLNQETIGNESADNGGKSAAMRKSTHKRTAIRPRKKKWLELKDVITNQKVNGLRDLFCTKLKRNNLYSQPVQLHYEKDTYYKSIFESKGIELKEYQQKIINLLSVYNIFSSIFIFTLSMVFPEIKQSIAVQVLEIVGAAIFTVQVILNFTTVKFTLGRKLQTVKQISEDYFRHKFAVDCINLIIILIYILAKSDTLGYFRIFTLFKLPDCMEKVEKLEVFFIESYYNEQYWSLVKVFLFNFCFAHMLAIILIGMSTINNETNWIKSKNLSFSPWYEKYIWSYYWGTTIMLTIGFGDLTPVCYKEALCMIFIETISCMVLAYNINCVGSLIAYIRSQDIEKSKNMKIFKKLADKHGISQSLTWKINSYIEEHTNIKKMYNIEEEVQFVEKLPTAFRTDYLKQANKTIFQRLFFFTHLMDKTLFSLAEKIEMKITHPEETILNVQKNFNIFILKNGQIGYISRKINRKYNKYVFDKMKVEQNASPFLLNTNFITKNRTHYGIKSIVYSVLYFLQYESLIDILKETHLDYELYCRMRDKQRNKMDQFQVFPCEFCPHQNHTKFSCPKLHFMPIQQHIMNKYIYKEKRDKNKRNPNFTYRNQLQKESSLACYIYNKDIYDEKLKEESYTQIKGLKKQKFVIDQLRSLENENENAGEERDEEQYTYIHKLEAMAMMQSKFIENTQQIIKIHIDKALGVEKGEDEVWLLDLDRMKNYKDYFAENNPCNLVTVFSIESRVKKHNENNVRNLIGNFFLSVMGKTTSDQILNCHQASRKHKLVPSNLLSGLVK